MNLRIPNPLPKAFWIWNKPVSSEYEEAPHEIALMITGGGWSGFAIIEA